MYVRQERLKAVGPILHTNFIGFYPRPRTTFERHVDLRDLSRMGDLVYTHFLEGATHFFCLYLSSPFIYRIVIQLCLSRNPSASSRC